jgi:hypothetical protein
VEEERPSGELEQEALELDKLDVSVEEREDVTPTAPPPPSTSSKSKSKPTDSDEKPTPSSTGVLPVLKGRPFLLSLVVGLLVGALILYLIPSKKPTLHQAVVDPNSAGKIMYVVSSYIGKGHSVRFKLSVPFKDNENKEDLMTKLGNVKHRLSGAARLPEVAKSISEKDFHALQTHILKIASDVTAVPLEQLDLEGLSLE